MQELQLYKNTYIHIVIYIYIYNSLHPQGVVFGLWWIFGEKPDKHRRRPPGSPVRIHRSAIRPGPHAELNGAHPLSTEAGGREKSHEVFGGRGVQGITVTVPGAHHPKVSKASRGQRDRRIRLRS